MKVFSLFLLRLSLALLMVIGGADKVLNVDDAHRAFDTYYLSPLLALTGGEEVIRTGAEENALAEEATTDEPAAGDAQEGVAADEAAVAGPTGEAATAQEPAQILYFNALTVENFMYALGGLQILLGILVLFGLLKGISLFVLLLVTLAAVAGHWPAIADPLNLYLAAQGLVPTYYQTLFETSELRMLQFYHLIALFGTLVLLVFVNEGRRDEDEEE